MWLSRPMKLIYLYITNSGTFQNVNINLGGRFVFNYYPNNESLDFQINEFYTDGFFDVVSQEQFDYAVISSVSAIVGENGTGKTTFLEFIKTYLVRGQGGFKAKGIVGFEDVRNGSFHLYHSEDIKLSNASLDKIRAAGFSWKSTTERILPHNATLRDKLAITQYKIIPEDQRVDYIFFSNIFDRKQEVEVEGLLNISTNHLLKQDMLTKIERGQFQPGIQFVEEHRFSEVLRDISFITTFRNEHGNLLGFELPTSIDVTIIESVLSRSYDTDGYTTPELISQIKQYRNKIVAKNKLTVTDYFKLNFITTALCNFFNEYYKYSQFQPYDFKQQRSFEEFILTDFHETFTVYIDYLVGLMKSNFANLYNQLIAVKQLITFLQEYFKDRKVTVEPLAIRFDLSNQQNADLFYSFYENFKASFQFESYLNFNWRDLSTGEKALLNIYSRFFYLSDQEISKRGENLILGRNIIVLLDEFELYLHPTWQKEALYKLLKILPVILRTGTEHRRSIQIIFTTNAPILLSDIPATNVTFLKRENINGKSLLVIKDGLNDQHQTFASNIHTLLSDSFFMKSGLMGELATVKINGVIRDLTKSHKISSARRNELAKIIQQIGEPVLKHKLMQMYNDRFNIDIHKRLDILEKKLNIEPDDQDQSL